MDMNTATPPKKGLKTRPYSMDMEDHIVSLPKNGLKTRPYSMDMNKDIATLPKKGLKTRPYNIYYLLTGCKGHTRKYKPKVFHTARACEGCLENQGLVFPGTARAPS